MAKCGAIYLSFASVAAFLTCFAEATDPYGLIVVIDGKVDDAIANFTALTKGQNAAAAFEDARGEIVDALRPVMQNANVLSMENQTRSGGSLSVSGIISGIIDKVKHAIEDCIDYAATVVKDFLDYGIDQIKNQIIDEIGKQIQNILSQLFAGISQILDQFWKIIEKTNCAVISGNIDKILEFLDDLGSGCSALESCCRQIGYDVPTSLRRIASEAPTKLYDLKVCRRTQDISEKSSTVELAKAYVDTQIQARKFFCAYYGSSAARDHFSQAYALQGHRYFTWNRAAATGCDTPQACYGGIRQTLINAQRRVPDTLVPIKDVVEANKGIASALATPQKCDCYTEEIGPDTTACPGKDCEWAGCSKTGYFASGYLFTDINGHDGYELVPNGYSNKNAPVQCCRPCFTFPAPPAGLRGSTSELRVSDTVDCKTGEACYKDALGAVDGLRSSLQGKAGKRSLEKFSSAVHIAMAKGFETCGECHAVQLSSDTGECSDSCEWAKCPAEDGSFLSGLLFTKLSNHDGYELIPNSYSSSLTPAKCCTSCLNVVITDMPSSMRVGHRSRDGVGNCTDALRCYEAALSLLDSAIDEPTAKVSRADLTNTVKAIEAAFTEPQAVGEYWENIGSDTGQCNDDCEWAQCSQSGSLLTGLLFTKIHDHAGYELAPNGYAPTPNMKPARCASPSFRIGNAGSREQISAAERIVV